MNEHDADTQRIKRIRPGYLERLALRRDAGDEQAGHVLHDTLHALDTRLNDLHHEVSYGNPDPQRSAALHDELLELQLVQQPLAEVFLALHDPERFTLQLATAPASTQEHAGI